MWAVISLLKQSLVAGTASVACDVFVHKLDVGEKNQNVTAYYCSIKMAVACNFLFIDFGIDFIQFSLAF